MVTLLRVAAFMNDRAFDFDCTLVDLVLIFTPFRKDILDYIQKFFQL